MPSGYSKMREPSSRFPGEASTSGRILESPEQDNDVRGESRERENPDEDLPPVLSELCPPGPLVLLHGNPPAKSKVDAPGIQTLGSMGLREAIPELPRRIQDGQYQASGHDRHKVAGSVVKQA